MKTVILAAGRGSRLSPLTDDRPKAMVELGGRPLIAWQIAALRAAGLGPIAIVTGYRGDRLAPFGDARIANPRWNDSNMVRSLLTAADWARGGDVFVSYSDIFYPAEAARRLAATADDIAIAYDPDWLALWSQRFADPLSDAETFRIDDAGRLIEIGARPTAAAEVAGQYMGLLRFSAAGFAALEAYLAGLEPAEVDRLDMTGLLSRLIGQGRPIRGVAVPGPWGEVDDRDDLALYEAMIRDGRLTAS